MMRGMSFLPGLGLGRNQHVPREFALETDHDPSFGFGFLPLEAYFVYMAH